MKKEEKKKIKVTHIMASGEVRDTLEGYVVPPGTFPQLATDLILKIARKEI